MLRGLLNTQSLSWVFPTRWSWRREKVESPEGGPSYIPLPSALNQKTRDSQIVKTLQLENSAAENSERCLANRRAVLGCVGIAVVLPTNNPDILAYPGHTLGQSATISRYSVDRYNGNLRRLLEVYCQSNHSVSFTHDGPLCLAMHHWQIYEVQLLSSLIYLGC